MERIKLPVIFHIIDSLGSGGAEKALVTNLRSWSQDPKYRHVVAMLFTPCKHPKTGNVFWLDEILGLGIEVRYLNFRGKGSLLGAIFCLTKMIKKEKPVLLHAQLTWSDIVGRLAGLLAGVPVVSTIHNLNYLPEARIAAKLSRPKRSLLCFFHGLTARLACRRLIAVSQTVAGCVSKYLRYPKNRIDVIHDPVVFENLQNSSLREDSTIDLRRELGLSPEQRVLLNVGRVVYPKNLLVLAQAMSEVLKRIPNTVLLQIGSHADVDYCTSLVEEISRLNIQSAFLLLGERRDVSRFFQLAELFIFPSIFEGLGIALIEAAGQGCCCIASDIASHREILKDGVTGRLVASDRPSVLAQAIVDLLNDPPFAQQMGKAAQTEVRKKFNPEIISEQVLRVFENCRR